MIQEHTIIIGAGPCGLAAAISLQRIGIKPLVIEKRNIVHSISQYPTYMSFFSTAERLEIGDIPFTTANDKPTRLEALNYYRTAAQRHNLRIQPFMTVQRITKTDNGFILDAVNQYDEPYQYEAKYVIVSTGYFDHPNMLGIPGEELPKVSHFFREAHPYTGLEVAIIGGSNSSIDAALELERVGARVTIIYRGEQYSKSIKPWVRPIIESKVENGHIKMLFSSRVEQIHNRTIEVSTPEGIINLDNDYVLALTGFHPDHEFLTTAGVTFEPEGHPTFNQETMESNVPGIYLAGVVVSRKEDANEIFIESGRFHGDKIAAHLKTLGEGNVTAHTE
ncbi:MULTISPECIES: YpdA family putative bacillithiol disulfide reductase [Paenibacillus]|uniref:YpdA family putative bacillithiol disulfide reductase n=1 Tax=Paenibacillus TaxID=44249 RepID=UPI00203A7AEB|nr:YpdA family putative bacillithiol disulfide reductase [Paenibacillus camelliae]MCM3631766.1 YpdA family putative bacillithiol disulfide reductase [Paenibacillus camelliae]